MRFTRQEPITADRPSGAVESGPLAPLAALVAPSTQGPSADLTAEQECRITDAATAITKLLPKAQILTESDRAELSTETITQLITVTKAFQALADTSTVIANLDSSTTLPHLRQVLTSLPEQLTELQRALSTLPQGLPSAIQERLSILAGFDLLGTPSVPIKLPPIGLLEFLKSADTLRMAGTVCAATTLVLASGGTATGIALAAGAGALGLGLAKATFMNQSFGYIISGLLLGRQMLANQFPTARALGDRIKHQNPRLIGAFLQAGGELDVMLIAVQRQAQESPLPCAATSRLGAEAPSLAADSPELGSRSRLAVES